MCESEYFIKAKAKSDYIMHALKLAGKKVDIPYKDYTLVLRCLREIWFRLRIPGKRIWYNSKVKKANASKIVVLDSLIVPDYLEWVCDTHKESKVIFRYDNRVAGETLKPSDVCRDNLEFETFDVQDSKKYEIRLIHPKYLNVYAFPQEEKVTPIYDIVYLGRDKGRAEKLLSLEEEFKMLGLRTYFHICADRRYQRYQKAFYKEEIEYTGYIDLLKKTRAHLNFVQEGQTSITQRDLESVFDQVKCITNNQGIKDFELYEPSRFFVLGQDDMQDLPAFLDMPFKPVPKDKLVEYSAM